MKFRAKLRKNSVTHKWFYDLDEIEYTPTQKRGIIIVFLINAWSSPQKRLMSVQKTVFCNLINGWLQTLSDVIGRQREAVLQPTKWI